MSSVTAGDVGKKPDSSNTEIMEKLDIDALRAGLELRHLQELEDELSSFIAVEVRAECADIAEQLMLWSSIISNPGLKLSNSQLRIFKETLRTYSLRLQSVCCYAQTVTERQNAVPLSSRYGL